MVNFQPVRSRGQRRGLSLMETLIAIFIITFAVLEMAALFHAALDGARRTKKVAVATTLANKRMEEIVYWASYDNHFANWSSIDGNQSSDSLYPDFLVTSESEPLTQYSPCSLTEQRFPVAEQRTMVSSARKVRVRVTWAPSDARNEVDLYGVVGAPARLLDQVEINETIPLPVGPFGSSVNLTVKALDEEGQPISDLFYDWSLAAGRGNGELTPARDGRSAALTDHVYNPGTETYQAAPGSALLKVRATYMGVTKKQNQAVLFGP